MTHAPDARILSGPALARVRSALTSAANEARVLERHGWWEELNVALDSLNTGKPVEDEGLYGPPSVPEGNGPVAWKRNPPIRPRDTVTKADLDDLRAQIDALKARTG